MEMNITPTFGYGELTAKVKWGKTPPATKYGALKGFSGLGEQGKWRDRMVLQKSKRTPLAETRHLDLCWPVQWPLATWGYLDLHEQNLSARQISSLAA